MAHDVFISYPHQEKPTADAACAKLEAEGIRCWIASRDIAPSATWAAAIVDAIDQCRVMVLIFSAHANRSAQVEREVRQALDGGKPVLPFRIEDVSPEKGLRYYLGSVHWLDALTPPLEQHLKKLVASVGSLVRTASPRQRAGSAPQRDEAAHHRIQQSERRGLIAPETPSRKAIAKRKEPVYLSYSDEDVDLASKILAQLKSRFTAVFNAHDFDQLARGFETMADQRLKSARVGIALLSQNYFRNKRCVSEGRKMAALERQKMQQFIPVKLHNEALDLPEWMSGEPYLRLWKYRSAGMLMQEIMRIISEYPVRPT
jgi:hypothetical protein